MLFHLSSKTRNTQCEMNMTRNLKGEKKYLDLLLIMAVVLAAGSIMTSCEEILSVDLRGNNIKRLTVEGMITTDTTRHRVRLSYTGDYFTQSGAGMVSDAEVTITDGEKTYVLHEEEAGNYYTLPDAFGEVGKTYTLHIKLTDSTEYEASETLRPCVAIDSINQSQNYNSFLSGYGYDAIAHILYGSFVYFRTYRCNI